jgi:hypothetical protein
MLTIHLLLLSVHHQFQYNLYASAMDRATDSPVFSFQQSLPSIAGKKITLSFAPASPADASLIASYLPQPHADGTPIQPSELPTSLPGYLIHLTAELRLDGQVVATGGSFTMGSDLVANMGLYDPVNGWAYGNDSNPTAGEYIATHVDLQGVSSGELQALKDRLTGTQAKLAAAQYAGITKEDLSGDILYSATLSYFAANQAASRIAQRAAGVVEYCKPSFGNFLATARTAYFSCKGRGVCPSCNTRRMVETAAHLTDHVFPKLPVRQWVLPVPERLRYFLQRDVGLQGAVLRIFLKEVERCLREHSPGCDAQARIGAVAFHRFGSSLNGQTRFPHLNPLPHTQRAQERARKQSNRYANCTILEYVHFHCCVVDEAFEIAANTGERQGVDFHAATELDEPVITGVQEQVRRRILRIFVRRGLIDQGAANLMGDWGHCGGFSVDASVRIAGADRAGLERLLRYCARPPFALEHLRQLDAEHLVYHSPKQGMDGAGDLVIRRQRTEDRGQRTKSCLLCKIIK